MGVNPIGARRIGAPWTLKPSYSHSNVQPCRNLYLRTSCSMRRTKLASNAPSGPKRFIIVFTAYLQMASYCERGFILYTLQVFRV